MSMMPPGGVRRIDRKRIHPTSGKVHSRKSASSILYKTPAQVCKDTSSAHLRLVTYGYMLWCWIDMRDRGCAPATVDWGGTTFVSCVA
jgi:hypothetical protein